MPSSKLRKRSLQGANRAAVETMDKHREDSMRKVVLEPG
jgi:hypothetical protein